MALADFPLLSFDQANPALVGLQKGVDLSGSMLQQRLQSQYAPQIMQNEVLKQKIANALSQNDLNYAPQMSQAELQQKQLANQWYGRDAAAKIGLENSQSGLYGSEAAKNRFLLQNPLLMTQGPMQQLGALVYAQKAYPNLFSNQGQQNGPPQQEATSSQVQAGLPGLGGGLPMQQVAPQQQGQSNDLAQSIMKSVIDQIKLPGARAQLYNQKVTGAQYLDAPPDTKRYLVAQATALGINPDQATKDFIAGKSLEQMAKEQGFGSNRSGWPTPDFMPTVATLSRNQQRQTAVSELNSVEPFINSSLGPYSQTIHGYSPAQVLDSFNSLNANTPEGQAKKNKLSDFLAATIVVPEYNAIRARAMGVQNIGIDAMKSIGSASMNSFNKFQGLVPQDVYESAQKKANDLIRQMNTAATKASLVPFIENNQNLSGGVQQDSMPQGNQSTSNIQTGKVRVINPDGKAGYIPEGQLDEALKSGYRRG